MCDSAIEETSSIRLASDADMSVVGEIYAHYVRESTATFDLEAPDSAQWLQRRAAIVEAGLPFLVAEIDGHVGGYAYVAPWKGRPAYQQTVEDSIYLAPRAAGRGLGGALLDELLERCQRAGLREVIAVITDSGEPASMAMHRRRGFTEAGRLRRVGFKFGSWLDTVLLQRSLVSTS